MFKNIYNGKKVLITGNTGFKGSWLTIWLLSLNAKVVGISDSIPTKPSLFKSAGIETKINQIFVDIRDTNRIKKIIAKEKPDFIFHLAAQAIVSTSYQAPLDTFTTNSIGTISILEGLKLIKNNCVTVFITSDKCYENVEWSYGYREIDRLGGKDIYSSSKAAAEIAIYSYYHSFFKDKKNIRFAIARAGNVIGGGDWAKDRIVVDCMKAWSKGEAVTIRSPNSTRPWQHVLEPLSGYLLLGQVLKKSSRYDGEPFNFGPKNNQDRTVRQLINSLANNWSNKNKPQIKILNNRKFFESSLLKLNCDKSLAYLNWEPVLFYEETARFVTDWYNYYFASSKEIFSFTQSQVNDYCLLAKERGKIWTTK